MHCPSITVLLFIFIYTFYHLLFLFSWKSLTPVNSTSSAAATTASEAKTVATAAQQSATAAANQIAYADFAFTGNSVAANGTSVVTAFSIAKTGYTAVGVTMYAASEYGNGMAYIPVMPDATHCAIFVKNYNGGKAFTASGKVRVAYKKN